MILLTLLFITLLILAITLIVVAIASGITFVAVFGDIIIFALIVTLLIKFIKKKHRN